MSVAEAVKLFHCPPLSWPITHQKPLEPQIDHLLNDLLRFPPATDLHDHPLVINGGLILQSKASCMPAHALAPRKGWHIIDCCAAPGNKTTHVSALLMKAGGGRVYAFDKDQRRLSRLNDNAARAGASQIIKSQCIDFLTVDPKAPQFESVKGILLDPSCSGSGTTTTRMDHLSNNSNIMSQERIEELAIFQEKALRHALSFPNLERLVYSTCSIHDRENEVVVLNILPLADELGFCLTDPFPLWKRRGHDLFKQASHLIRTDASLDETDGFFVAVFERRNH
jgi:25S rRNA (cytosine2278-C5)-methyltransferase